MSNWSHNICAFCWDEKNPGREAHKMDGGPEEKCCFCGNSNTDGIYVREDPSKTLCKGNHDE